MHMQLLASETNLAGLGAVVTLPGGLNTSLAQYNTQALMVMLSLQKQKQSDLKFKLLLPLMMIESDAAKML